MTDKKKDDEKTPEALQSRAGQPDPGVSPSQRPDVAAEKDLLQRQAAEAARREGQGGPQVGEGVASTRDVATRRGDEGFDPNDPEFGGLSEPDLPAGTQTAATPPAIDPYTGEALPGAKDTEGAQQKHDAAVQENEAAAERKKKS